MLFLSGIELQAQCAFGLLSLENSALDDRKLLLRIGQEILRLKDDLGSLRWSIQNAADFPQAVDGCACLGFHLVESINGLALLA